MVALIKKLWNDESGQGLTEYALVIGLVSVGLITVLGLFRGEIAALFSGAASSMDTATPTQAGATGTLDGL